LKYGDAIKLQKEISHKVIARDDFNEIKRICGVDVAYDNNIAYCSAVVMEQGQIVEAVDAKTKVMHLYIPGLLMLRESEPIFQTLRMLKNGYDLLLIDGHGLLHPRKCGLACYVGVTLDKPAIGVAKSRLCGTVRPDGFIELHSQILGYLLGKLYISVGHRISLKSAISIIKERSIEPLKLADANSKAQKRRKGL